MDNTLLTARMPDSGLDLVDGDSLNDQQLLELINHEQLLEQITDQQLLGLMYELQELDLVPTSQLPLWDEAEFGGIFGSVEEGSFNDQQPLEMRPGSQTSIPGEVKFDDTHGLVDQTPFGHQQQLELIGPSEAILFDEKGWRGIDVPDYTSLGYEKRSEYSDGADACLTADDEEALLSQYLVETPLNGQGRSEGVSETDQRHQDVMENSSPDVSVRTS